MAFYTLELTITNLTEHYILTGGGMHITTKLVIIMVICVFARFIQSVIITIVAHISKKGMKIWPML